MVGQVYWQRIVTMTCIAAGHPSPMGDGPNIFLNGKRARRSPDDPPDISLDTPPAAHLPFQPLPPLLLPTHPLTHTKWFCQSDSFLCPKMWCPCSSAFMC
jgi:hypothetical protein